MKNRGCPKTKVVRKLLITVHVSPYGKWSTNQIRSVFGSQDECHNVYNIYFTIYQHWRVNLWKPVKYWTHFHNVSYIQQYLLCNVWDFVIYINWKSINVVLKLARANLTWTFDKVNLICEIDIWLNIFICVSSLGLVGSLVLFDKLGRKGIVGFDLSFNRCQN